MRTKLLIALSALILFVMGLAASDKPEAGSSNSAPTQSTEPGSMPEVNRGAIGDFNQRFIEACRKKDNAAAIELWADDGVDLLPGMDPMVGKPAIAHWLNGLTEQTKGVKMLQCDVDWQKIQLSGDVVYEWGINTQTVALPDHADPLKNKGKITLVLRKQSDGSWRLALESWNSSPQPKLSP